MCGISGVFHYSRGLSALAGDHVSRDVLEAMAASMPHRGPDDSVCEVFGAAGFAFRRLSIIDLEGGRQPIPNEDESIWIEGNGEIYNYRELRSELESRGHRFRTHSDIETIVHGYEEWGLGVVDRLNGIFGFAIFDKRIGRVLLARDHLGVKPLYWYDDGKRLLWGSEMRTILSDSTVPRQLDVDSLRLFLHFGYLPSPHTLVNNIKKLRPGHLLVADEHGIDVRRYWNDVPETRTNADLDTTARDYADLFTEAVERQMVSDVPVGCLLSGGVDSGMVLAAASKYSDEPIKTFTVGFEGNYAYDEAAAAAETAALFGAEHHPITLDFNDFDGIFRETIDYLEEPVLSQSTFAYQRMTQVVREHVKVVVTGQGADEPWAGYDRYLGEKYSQHARWLFGSTIAETLGEGVPALARFRRGTSALGINDPVQRFAAIHQVFSPADVDRLAGPELRASSARAEDLIEYWQGPVSHLDELNQLLYVDTRLSLPDDLLFYGDKLSMSNSVEARVPILDRELVDFIERLPSSFKLRRGNGKHVHKMAAKAMLPPEIVDRKKFGFATPVDEWFAKDLGDTFERVVLGDGSLCAAHLDRHAMLDLLNEHRSGRRNHRRHLTALLSLELAAENLFSSEGSSASLTTLTPSLNRLTA